MNSNARRLKIKEELEPFDVANHLKIFDSFYSTHFTRGNLFILPCKDEFLPEIVERAINKRKPFSESKSELKDALIWKTYYKFVESNKLSDCIFLTKNTSDFCGKDKSKVHPDLLKDTDRFTVVNSTFEFIHLFGSEFAKPERKILAFVESTEIDNLFVHERIEKYFLDRIETKADRFIERMQPSDVFEEVWMGGYVSGMYSDILDCENVEYKIVGAKASVYADVFVAYESEVYEYNSVRDKGEDHFNYSGEASLIFVMRISFEVDHDDNCSNFEISDFALHEVN